jgi:hypothetical protein
LINNREEECIKPKLKNTKIICVVFIIIILSQVSLLQVEDFINETSLVAMSSVPVQFLIYVLPTPSCPQLPLILPLTDCLEVQVGTSVNFTLYAMTLCNGTTSIIDIRQILGISGMQVSNVTNSTSNIAMAYVTLSWTPQLNQIGWQEFCAIAYTK